jgi:hypothetical protein
MLLIMIWGLEARVVVIDRPCQAITGGNQRVIGLCRKRGDEGIENGANLFGQILDGSKFPNDFISGLISCLSIIDKKRRACNIQKTSRSMTSGI